MRGGSPRSIICSWASQGPWSPAQASVCSADRELFGTEVSLSAKISAEPENPKPGLGVPFVAQPVKDLAGIHEGAGLSPDLAQWDKDPALPQVGCRCGSDLVLLWLWCQPAAAALIQPLAWKFPYAAGIDLRKKKKKKDKGLADDICPCSRRLLSRAGAKATLGSHPPPHPETGPHPPVGERRPGL